MATVRITNDIRYHVRNKFEELYRERIERKTKELSTLERAASIVRTDSEE